MEVSVGTTGRLSNADGLKRRHNADGSLIVQSNIPHYLRYKRNMTPNYYKLYNIYKLLFQTRLTRIHAQWSIDNNTW